MNYVLSTLTALLTSILLLTLSVTVAVSQSMICQSADFQIIVGQTHLCLDDLTYEQPSACDVDNPPPECSDSPPPAGAVCDSDPTTDAPVCSHPPDCGPDQDAGECTCTTDGDDTNGPDCPPNLQ